MRFLIPAGAGLAFLAVAATPALADKYTVAVFSGLDKTTARVTSFDAKVGEVAQFGSLEVLVRACDKKPPEEPPRTAAYVEIRQLERDEETEGEVNPPVSATPQTATPADGGALVFQGWMYAESPGLNALEHPVYDIWVTDCKTSSGPASSGSE
ncbi:DUF2155 domain-containing protein [Parvibaculum sp.]|uniref:DUF2155 domain-containing protein n=1 Tax=Parvibaculum sp. TaxID=2024848 RepID=UPI0032EE4BAD